MTRQMGVRIKTEKDNDRIMGIGAMSVPCDNQMEYAIHLALARTTKLIMPCDDTAVRSLSLRFETEGEYVQAIFRKQETRYRHRDYQGCNAAELTEKGELFVGIGDIDREFYNEDKELAVAVAKFFALSDAFRLMSQHEGILSNSYILHFDIVDNALYAVFEKQ